MQPTQAISLVRLEEANPLEQIGQMPSSKDPTLRIALVIIAGLSSAFIGASLYDECRAQDGAVKMTGEGLFIVGMGLTVSGLVATARLFFRS